MGVPSFADLSAALNGDVPNEILRQMVFAKAHSWDFPLYGAAVTALEGDRSDYTRDIEHLRELIDEVLGGEYSFGRNGEAAPVMIMIGHAGKTWQANLLVDGREFPPCQDNQPCRALLKAFAEAGSILESEFRGTPEP